MQAELLLAFVLIYTIDSITPGPAVAMVMARGASVGLIRTMPLIAGLVLGDLILFVMALLGLAALAMTLGPLFFVIKWLGIAYLLYLAYSMWTTDPVVPEAVDVQKFSWKSFFITVLLPLGNPRAVGFYVALLPAFMDVRDVTVSTGMSFGLVIVVVWGLSLTAYAGLADRGRRYFNGPSILRLMNRCSAGALLGVAGTLAVKN